MVEVKNKRGQVCEKPNIERDYNDGMAGIDRSDQMLSYYSGLRNGTERLVSITLRFLLSMHIGSTQNLEIKSATFSLYDGKVSAW